MGIVGIYRTKDILVFLTPYEIHAFPQAGRYSDVVNDVVKARTPLSTTFI